MGDKQRNEMIMLTSSGFLIRRYLFFFLLFSCSVCVYGFPDDGSGVQRRDSLYRLALEKGVLTLDCRFSYVQGSSGINPVQGDNPRELARLDAFISAAVSDTSLCVKRIGLTGFSSIEGSYAVNERLARDRVQSFKTYLEEKYSFSGLFPVDVSWVAEDWGGLYNLMLGVHFRGREEVLRLIEEVDVFRGREARLMRVQGGKVYKWLLKDYFPALRRVEIRVEYDLQRMLEENGKTGAQAFAFALGEEREKIRYEIEESLPRIDTVVPYAGGRLEILGLGEIHSITVSPEVSPQPSPKERGENLAAPGSLSKGEGRNEAAGYRFAVKTNLLNLAGFARGIDYTTPLPNLSLEYFLTRRFSVEAGAEYSNWKYNKGREFQGSSGYRIEPRYRLRHSRSLLGIYVGVYGQGGDFNLRTLERDSSDETYNLTGRYLEGGLSTGCCLPLSSHWGFDIGVRGGYRYDKGKVYERRDEGNYHLYDRTSKRLRLSAVVFSLSYRWGKKK
jgi:hypothetical protein